MRGAKWTDRGRQLIVVVLSILVIALVSGGAVSLLGFIDHQLEKNSERQVETLTKQVAKNVTERVSAVRNALTAFTIQSSDPDDVVDALRALEDQFGFSDVAYATVDGTGVHADGSPFAVADLTVPETALTNGVSSYSLMSEEGEGGQAYMAQRPLSIDGVPAGALYVQIPLSMFSSCRQTDMFEDQDFLLLIEAESGTILMSSADGTAISGSTLYDLLDADAGTSADTSFDIDDLTLLLGEDSNDELSGVCTMVSSGDAGLFTRSVNGKSSYVCVVPVDHGEWYLCDIISVKGARAEAWGVMTVFELVFVVVVLCLIGLAILAFSLYRRHVREKNVAMLSQLYKALSETLEMAVNLYSPVDHVVTPIVAKSADIVGGSMVELLSDGASLDRLGISSEGRLLFDRIRTDGITGKEQGEFSVDDPVLRKRRWISYAVNELAFQDKRQILVVMRDMTVEKELQLSMKDAMTAAEAANQAKSDFLSRMSHEIRTPMNVIIGMLQITLNNLDDEEKIRECLEKIDTASSHLLNLINDVLDISKIESGRMVLASKPFSLDSLISRTEAVIRPQCEQKKQDLTVLVDREGDDVFIGDDVRLEQMLVNLLTNAVKYTREGGHIKLSVTVKNETATAYRRVTIVVEDDGIGMSEEFQERLFEPFHMEGRSSAQGTGLGMSIVKNIVTMLGGDIRVRSEIDRGTTFTVTFSLRVAFEPERRSLELKGDVSSSDWAADISVAKRKNARNIRRFDRTNSKGVSSGVEKELPVDDEGSVPAPDVSGVRALLAEDNELNAEIARELLSEAGLTVDWAADGREACRMFEDSPVGTYDIILMDVQMPELNGYEATRHIRALERADAKEIPIIAMSANAFAEDANASLASGMNAHLSKPINIDHVVATIAEQIGRPRSRADGMEER